MKTLNALLLLCVLCGHQLLAQEPIAERVVLTGLDTPWEILWGPDNWIWMTERGGRVSRVNPETREHVVVTTIANVTETGESGLLGMALHEEDELIRVYLVYTYRNGQQMLRERLVRYDYNGTTLVNEQVLLSDIPASSNHDGSRLVIVGDKLFMTTGDAESMPLAQDHTSPNGKVLRMNLDGSIPSDNPYAQAPYPAHFFWTTGHRNSQGLHYASNGVLYASEHGPTTDDEINIIERKGNYGWPTVHGQCDQPNEMDFCEDSSVVEPIMGWTPTIATAGIEYYNSTAIPEWSNSLLLVTLKEQDLRRLGLSQDGRTVVSQTVYLDEKYGRLRDLAVSPDGRVFISTSNRDGRGNPVTADDRIIELRSASSQVNRPVLSDSIFCMDDSATLSFTTQGEFESDNVFTVQISRPGGTFDTLGPFNTRGTLAGETGGEIVIPMTDAGNGYRFRVIASNPADTSEATLSPHTVWWRPAASLSPVTQTLCGGGDSVVLTLSIQSGSGEISSIRWSTGDTGTTLVVREPGNYSATVFDANGCSSVPTSVQISRGVIPEVAIISERVNFCEGDSVMLEASGVGGRQYLWSTGQQTRTIWVRQSGTYWVEATSEDGCMTRSTDFTVTRMPYPPKPGIVRVDDTLVAPAEYASYQWYRNGTPLLNGREERFVVTSEGTYAVGVFNEAECETMSDPFEFRFSGFDFVGDEERGVQVAVHPHPVGDLLRIQFGEGLYGVYTITLTDVHGARVFMSKGRGDGERIRELSIQDLPSGPYVLRIETATAQRARMIIKR